MPASAIVTCSHRSGSVSLANNGLTFNRVRTSQCPRCGKPATRCRCDLKKSIRQRTKCEFTYILPKVTETENLSSTEAPILQPFQLIIQNPLQETTTDDDTLLAENNIICPRCILKLKRCRESQEVDPIGETVCQHCMLRAQIYKLKAEKKKLRLRSRDDYYQTIHKTKEDKLEIIYMSKKYKTESKVSCQEEDTGIKKTRKETEMNVPDKLQKFQYSPTVLNILRPKSMPTDLTKTQNMLQCDTNFLTYKEDHLPKKPTDVEKNVGFNTFIAEAEVSKASTFTSACTISDMRELQHKIKNRSLADICKTDQDIQTAKEKFKKPATVYSDVKLTESVSQEILTYHFHPIVPKIDTVHKQITSSELIRRTREELLDKEDKQKDRERNLASKYTPAEKQEQKEKLMVKKEEIIDPLKRKDYKIEQENVINKPDIDEISKKKHIEDNKVNQEKFQKEKGTPGVISQKRSREKENVTSKQKKSKEETEKIKNKEKEETEKRKIKEKEEKEKQKNKEKEEAEKRKNKEKEEAEKRKSKEKEEAEKITNKEKEEAEKRKNKEKEEAEKRKNKEKEEAEKRKTKEEKEAEKIKEKEEGSEKSKKKEIQGSEKSKNKAEEGSEKSKKKEKEEVENRKNIEENNKKKEDEEAVKKKKMEEEIVEKNKGKENMDALKKQKVEEKSKKEEQKLLNKKEETEAAKKKNEAVQVSKPKSEEETTGLKKNREGDGAGKKNIEEGEEVEKNEGTKKKDKLGEDKTQSRSKRQLQTESELMIYKLINEHKVKRAEERILLAEKNILADIQKLSEMAKKKQEADKKKLEEEESHKTRQIEETFKKRTLENLLASSSADLDMIREPKQLKHDKAAKIEKPKRTELIIGDHICHSKVPLPPDPLLQDLPVPITPILFKKKTVFSEQFVSSPDDKAKPIEEEHKDATSDNKASTKKNPSALPELQGPNSGIFKYALSDRSFIDKGWTVLPVEEVVRKMNVYRMRPAQPEFDWFERNKNKGNMQYNTGEKLAVFDNNGGCRWYYKNGRMALDYYNSEELNSQHRFVVYSNGEPDERGRSRPYTVLATFSHLGTGVVFDHGGKIRLKYNQTEGILLDREIGPVTTWKWHSLNDPPVLRQVMMNSKLIHKDQTILALGGKVDHRIRKEDDLMIAVENENSLKEMRKKQSLDFKPFQIKTKALKINENFSLKVLDQTTVYLIFREGSVNIKLNIGMILDHHEIVDTETASLGVVSNCVERFPAATDSIAALQRSVEHAQHFERNRTARERMLRPPLPKDSADRLVAGLSRPLKVPLRTLSISETASKMNIGPCKFNRKPPCNLYYNSRLP